MKTMKTMKTNLGLLIGTVLLLSCAPKQSDITGDTFLTMSNGTVKPVAGKEIFLFPIETDFDASFVKPLQSFINAAKYNIAKSEVEKICMQANEEIPNLIQSSAVKLEAFLSGDQFIDGLNESCNLISENITNLEAKIAADQSSVIERSKPITASMLTKEAQAKKVREEIYRLALNQGNILKNAQIAKINFLHSLSLNNFGFSDECQNNRGSFDCAKKRYSITNNTDYIILSVTLGPLSWKNEPLGSGTSIDKFKSFAFDNFYQENPKIIADSSTNQYNETIPGLKIGWTQTETIETYKGYRTFPTDRWIDENKEDLKTLSITYNPNVHDDYCYNSIHDCSPRDLFIIDAGVRDIVDVSFGMPIVVSTDPETKKKTHTSKVVNWVERGRKTSTYQSSPLHAELKVIEAEISELQDQIKAIESELLIQENNNKVAEFNDQLDSCNLAIDLRDTEIESQQCLNSLENKDALVNLISNSESSLGADVQTVFNNITEDDLGYDNFEQLLNAFAQNRNAKVAVSSIDGKYSFIGVPNGNYVIFASYEDRFNGNGHWFEEISVESELKYDLNNLNYKKSGVYSYLRDKIEK